MKDVHNHFPPFFPPPLKVSIHLRALGEQKENAAVDFAPLPLPCVTAA